LVTMMPRGILLRIAGESLGGIPVTAGYLMRMWTNMDWICGLLTCLSRGRGFLAPTSALFEGQRVWILNA
jgi:hypothetical protein